MSSTIVPVHKSCCDDAVIDIDQTELHELPKSLQERLQRFLAPLQQLVFYPYSRIDCGTMQVLTYIKDEEDKLILRLEHKPNINRTDTYGFGSATVDSLFGPDCSSDKRVKTGKDTNGNHVMRFSDDGGHLIFSSVTLKETTKVICDKEILGTINGKALHYLSTPYLIATNNKGEIIIEILINDNTSSVLSKPKTDFKVLSHGKDIGRISTDGITNDSGFVVSFLKDLDSSTKAVFLTTAYLVFQNYFSKPRFSNIHPDEEGSQCCIPDWNTSRAIPVIVITLVMSMLVTMTLFYSHEVM